MINRFLAVFAVFFLLSACSVSAAEINFDDLTEPGTGFTLLRDYSSQGFFIKDDVDSFQSFAAPQSENALFFGSANLIPNYRSAWVTLSSGSGSLFDMVSMDLHALDGGLAVDFYGYDLDGSLAASQQYSLDGTSWQTVNFNSDFRNLSSLKWQQGADSGFSFDNIRVNSVVPEPVSLVLFGAGGFTLAAAGRLRRKKQLNS